ncbi:6140_t:CDS:2 [Diversispora eburnea]|uniref:6140_t:CDS:1 n=1 Tax=Diversispora eburnea TaxID=1213867 RepID=A0A9N8VVM8_9GLOM|nr:6140_t:CDS:2 [Diversispora eburnea]
MTTITNIMNTTTATTTTSIIMDDSTSIEAIFRKLKDTRYSYSDKINFATNVWNNTEISFLNKEGFISEWVGSTMINSTKFPEARFGETPYLNLKYWEFLKEIIEKVHIQVANWCFHKLLVERKDEFKPSIEQIITLTLCGCNFIINDHISEYACTVKSSSSNSSNSTYFEGKFSKNYHDQLFDKLNEIAFSQNHNHHQNLLMVLEYNVYQITNDEIATQQIEFFKEIVDFLNSKMSQVMMAEKRAIILRSFEILLQIEHSVIKPHLVSLLDFMSKAKKLLDTFSKSHEMDYLINNLILFIVNSNYDAESILRSSLFSDEFLEE